MLGEGIVIFGTCPFAWSRRKAKASAKIVFGRVTLPSTRMAGGAYAYSPCSLRNRTALMVSPVTCETPPSW